MTINRMTKSRISVITASYPYPMVGGPHPPIAPPFQPDNGDQHQQGKTQNHQADSQSDCASHSAFSSSQA